MHGDEIAICLVANNLGGTVARYDGNRGNREQHLLADHFAQIRRGAAYPDIRQLGQSIALEFFELDLLLEVDHTEALNRCWASIRKPERDS